MSRTWSSRRCRSIGRSTVTHARIFDEGEPSDQVLLLVSYKIDMDGEDVEDGEDGEILARNGAGCAME